MPTLFETPWHLTVADSIHSCGLKSAASGEAEGFNGNNILDSVARDEHTGSYAPSIIHAALPYTLAPDQRFIMPLAAYFDESGANPTDPALVMAGFISDEKRWRAFSAKWKAAVVDDWGLDYFHMADFEARQGQFKGWPRDDESRRRLNYLLTLIIGHALGLISVAFPRALFDAYFPPGPKPAERLYRMTAGSVLYEASVFSKERALGQRIALVFERGARGRHQVQEAYDGFASAVTEHFRFLSLTFARKEDFEPLQAADVLAYESFRHFPKVYGNETRPIRYPLKRILDNVPHVFGVVDEAYLDSIQDAMS